MSALDVPEIVPDISVVVPHYSDLEGLDRCLAALMRQTMPRERFEVIVSDNMSPVGRDAVDAVIAGRARLVIATERGAGPARNAGAAVARGDTLAFTDSDCIPAPEWLAAGEAALAGVDLVGGAMAVSVEPGTALSGAQAFERVFAFDNRAYVERKGFTVTANLFCRRETFAAVGPFKVGVSEDLEWCQRARALGYRIGYAADALVSHPARPDWPTLIGKWRRLNAESYALTVEQAGGRGRWWLRSLALPASILVHAPRVLRSPSLTSGERVRALATLIRLRCWRFVDAQRLLIKGK